MGYTVVSTKIDPQTKKEAMATAQSLGVPLSVVIKAFLKQFIRTKTVTFSAASDEPSEYLIQAIKKARENRKKGKGSPLFDNAKDAIVYLHKQGV
mgnify:CR=1 FL=1